MRLGHRHARRGTRPQRGVGYVEILVATALSSVALLSYAAGTLQEHRAALAQETRSVTLGTLRHFVERLRADEDWASLYGRLAAKVRGTPVTQDFPPSAYYADFVTPPALGDVRVRVDVPVAYVPDPADLSGTALLPQLSENVTAPAYGLPYDLNGDGQIDGGARDDDYRALPLVIRFRWTPPGGGIGQELRISTWLTGER